METITKTQIKSKLKKHFYWYGRFEELIVIFVTLTILGIIVSAIFLFIAVLIFICGVVYITYEEMPPIYHDEGDKK